MKRRWELKLKQRLHPDTTWTAPFEWREIDTTSLAAVGAYIGRADGIDGGEIVLKYENADVACAVVGDGIFRLRLLDASGAAPPVTSAGIINREPNKCDLAVEESGETVKLSAGEISVEFTKRKFGYRLIDSSGGELLRCDGLGVEQGEHGFRSLANFALGEDDHFFGFGGKTVPPDRRGSTADMFSVKVYHERGDYGGFAMPFFLNPRGYGLLLNNPYPHVYFDLGFERDDAWSLYTPDGPYELYLLAGPGFSDILGRYYALSGRPTLPPKWMLGFWVSWCHMWTAADWEGWIERFRKEKWPIDVAELDPYWRAGTMTLEMESGQGCNLEWDVKNFGDGPAMVKKLHENNVNVCLHLNTRMYSGDVLEEGLAKGHLRKSSEKQVVSVLCKPESAEWNWAQYAPRVEEGVDTWWTDNGERVDGVLADGQPSRNLFGQIWNQFLFDGMESMGRHKRLVLSRGGWFGAQRCTIAWPGDTQPGADRLREDLWFAMNLGVSGVPFSTVDQGGFSEEPHVASDLMHKDENVIRRTIHGLMTFPVPRIHCGDKSAKFPWLYSEQVQGLYRYFLELRYRLFPYTYSASVEATKSAVPMMRPLAFDFSQDDASMAVDDQLMFGPSLMIAPVVEDGRSDRIVYLPPGRWIDFWTNEVLEGPQRIIVDAPLYEKTGLPIFVAADSLLPYRPLTQYNRDEPEETILLDLYADCRANYRLWEDADTFSAITCEPAGGGLQVSLGNNTQISRTYLLRRLAGGAVAAATCNGKELPSRDGRFEVVVAPGQTAKVELRCE